MTDKEKHSQVPLNPERIDRCVDALFSIPTKVERDYCCDVCGKPVDDVDNAVYLDAIIQGKSHLPFFVRRRHILCSPSRAQFIMHPKFKDIFDPRPEYDKRLMGIGTVEREERKHTQAWQELQRQCKERENNGEAGT